VPPLLRRSQSLEVGLSILLLFSREHREIGLYEMADLIGFSHATAHLYASTYVRFGVLEQRGSRKYRLTPRAADPGLSVIGAMRKALPVLTVLEELRDATGYTVSLGALNGAQVTYIHRTYAHGLGQYQADQDMRAGTHIPIHCTALGKALLASLSEMARRRIIACMDFLPYGPNSIMEPRDFIAELQELDHRKPIVSDEEFPPGARSIAMYVPRPQRELHFAVDVTVPAAALTVNQLLRQVGPTLRSAVALISRAASQ
jgi:IclR family acetate operon transcriptional repressor